MHSVISLRISKFSILSTLWLEYFWERYLNLKQLQTIDKIDCLPKEISGAMSPEVFEVSRKYSIQNINFHLTKNFVEIIFSTFLIYHDVLYRIWRIADFFCGSSESATSALWLLMTSALANIVYLPLDIYEAFIENNLSFTRDVINEILRDKIMSFLIFQVLSISAAVVIIFLVQTAGRLFFIWIWLVSCFLSGFIMTIMPSLIAPLVDNYTPLENGDLRTKIEDFAEIVDYPLGDIYLMKNTNTSLHGQAFCYGYFKKRHVVISEKILKEHPDFTNKHIVAILAHEFGHWYHNHLIKNMLLIHANLFMWFYIFWLFFQQDILYTTLGFEEEKPILVGLLVVIHYLMLPYNVWMTYLTVSLSRKFEIEADDFAIRFGKGPDLKEALFFLYGENFAFPVHDKLYAQWHFNHPSLLERVVNIESVLSNKTI